VAALTARDAEGVLRFLATAEELGGDEPFTPQVLDGLGALVRADWVMYCEQDRIRQHIRLQVEREGDSWSGGVMAPYWDIADEHPVCRRHNAGEARALKLSDFVTLRQLTNSHVYDVWFRPAGVDHELNVAIPSPRWHTKTFLFERGPGRDFTERDRTVLDVLQPHLGRLWHAAKTRRRLRAMLAALEYESEHAARGVLIVGPGAGVEVASPAARRLVREYFGESPERGLPRALADWLETYAPRLVRQRDDRRLTIERSGHTLLLEETRDALGLTPREREILAWVARGKTNAEIAQALWISPTTVRKHLENVYAKLGVRTRTAAAALFLGALEREERDERIS
jgi:DNA-binding CsgD family transcriptional regulator